MEGMEKEWDETCNCHDEIKFQVKHSGATASLKVPLDKVHSSHLLGLYWCGIFSSDLGSLAKALLASVQPWP